MTPDETLRPTGVTGDQDVSTYGTISTVAAGAFTLNSGLIDLPSATIEERIAGVRFGVCAASAISGTGSFSTYTLSWEMGASIDSENVAIPFTGPTISNVPIFTLMRSTAPDGDPWTLAKVNALGVRVSAAGTATGTATIYLGELMAEIYLKEPGGDLLSGDLTIDLLSEDADEDLLAGDLLVELEADA